MSAGRSSTYEWMKARIQFKNICSRYHDSRWTLEIELKHRLCLINPYNDVKLGCLLDPHLRPCTYPTETTVIPISEGKISTISETGKPILLKYQSSSQFSDIPSRARGGCLVHWRFLSTSVNFLYGGISAGFSPERMTLNPNKTLIVQDKWRKIKHL